jgi:hypothetical protein
MAALVKMTAAIIHIPPCHLRQLLQLISEACGYLGISAAPASKMWNDVDNFSQAYGMAGFGLDSWGGNFSVLPTKY